jgi:hypothetical protein
MMNLFYCPIIVIILWVPQHVGCFSLC